ncbi:MAG: NAD(+)/NADH kinase [Oscillospiraceae bacterium]|nr:NAD(+)/NADH kinase [Oscillospiraceae bacterium]
MKAYIVSKLDMPMFVSDKLKQFGIEQVNKLNECDVVITIGGDGTILKTGVASAQANKPLLGINTGRLGFMATLEYDELDKLERLITGEYSISQRMLLDVTIDNKKYNALNDVVLSRGVQSKLPEFIVYRNEIEVIRIRADGMIISTPTGSTAYSLSAGGPIIEPEMQCLELTALCPHTLFNRPMIFSGEARLSVSYLDCDSVFVSVDGGERTALQENQEVIIKQSPSVLQLIDINGNSFYNSVHNKLMRPLKEIV